MGSRTSACSKYAVVEERNDLHFRVKRVSEQSSSCWRSVKVVQVKIRRKQRVSVHIFLRNGELPDLIFHDPNGEGSYDCVDHCGVGSLDDVLGKYSSKGLPMLAFDTTEDGRADTIILDSSDSRRYDRILSRSTSPLSFLPTMSKVSSDNTTSEEDMELFTGLWTRYTIDEWNVDAHPLAPGWEKKMSTSKNRFYFVNTEQKQTTWEVENAELPAWPTTPKEPTSSIHLSSDADRDCETLAVGWKRVRSKTKDRDYYLHEATGRTTWKIQEAQRPPQASDYPSYWKHAKANSAFIELLHTNRVYHHVQMLLASTFLCIRTRDRKTRIPQAIEALKIWRVENAAVWRQYEAHRARLQSLTGKFGNPLPSCNPPPKTSELLPQDLQGALHASVGEVYLFHGTSPLGALGIVDSGFDVSRAEKTACYGPGIYFAECSSKSDEYARAENTGVHEGNCVLLLCRVCLGRVLPWQREFCIELEKEWEKGDYDSILGDRVQLRGTYREFILPPESGHGAYPEYVVLYRRRFEDI